MRSSKHQTRASTDTRSLATAFGGSVRALRVALAIASEKKRGGCACGAGQPPASVGPRRSRTSA